METERTRNVAGVNSSTGYTSSSSGTIVGNPNVGTYTKTFSFIHDPWAITDGGPTTFQTLSAIVLSISKVLDPNNPTVANLVLSYQSNAAFEAVGPIPNWNPPISIELSSVNQPLVQINLGKLPTNCGIVQVSLPMQFNPVNFDNAVGAQIQLGVGSWTHCP